MIDGTQLWLYINPVRTQLSTCGLGMLLQQCYLQHHGMHSLCTQRRCTELQPCCLLHWVCLSTQEQEGDGDKKKKKGDKGDKDGKKRKRDKDKGTRKSSRRKVSASLSIQSGHVYLATAGALGAESCKAKDGAISTALTGYRISYEPKCCDDGAPQITASQ